jgi:Domain of unknown function (DUF4336)
MPSSGFWLRDPNGGVVDLDYQHEFTIARSRTVTLEERVNTSTQPPAADRSWRFWFTLPIYPYRQRRTLRREVLANEIWTFEQVQGIFYVVVPIRMTVVKLIGGGLLVYAPVAPTGECLQLMNELVAMHGDVRYIILPTISGLEHKVFVGPFARSFPQAQVWVTPDQWSFPINLPLNWLGFPIDRTHVLPPDSSQTPFGSEFDYAILKTIDLGPGQFAEVAVFHRQSRTLLLTDSIVSIPQEPPEIVQLTSYPLLFHARDRAHELVSDTPAHRQRGWQRICLFALYFQPSVLNIRKWSQTWRESFTAPLRSRQSYFGIYPFEWQAGWPQSFKDLLDDRLLVAPILQTLILNRAPSQTIVWVDRVAQWDFERIIPCHFDAPISTTPAEFRAAFHFLDREAKLDAESVDVNAGLLRAIDRQLVRWRLIFPARDRT